MNRLMKYKAEEHLDEDSSYAEEKERCGIFRSIKAGQGDETQKMKRE